MIDMGSKVVYDDFDHTRYEKYGECFLCEWWADKPHGGFHAGCNNSDACTFLDKKYVTKWYEWFELLLLPFALIFLILHVLRDILLERIRK